jgi:hypothetical protein
VAGRTRPFDVGPKDEDERRDDHLTAFDADLLPEHNMRVGAASLQNPYNFYAILSASAIP